MTLADEHFTGTGHRLERWDALTGVNFETGVLIADRDLDRTPQIPEFVSFKPAQSVTLISPESFMALIKNSQVYVRFTDGSGKLNGMLATLKENLIPENCKKYKVNFKVQGINLHNDLVTVYSADRGGWRSLRVSSIISISN